MHFHRELLDRGFEARDFFFAWPVGGMTATREVRHDPYAFVTKCVRCINERRERGEDVAGWEVAFGFLVEECPHGKAHQRYRFYAMVATAEGRIFDPNWPEAEVARPFLWDRQIDWRTFQFIDQHMGKHEVWMPHIGRCRQCQADSLLHFLNSYNNRNGGLVRVELLRLVAEHPTYHNPALSRDGRLCVRRMVHYFSSKGYLYSMHGMEWHFLLPMVVERWNYTIPENKRVHFYFPVPGFPVSRLRGARVPRSVRAKFRMSRCISSCSSFLQAGS